MERGTNHMEPEKVRAPNIRDVARLAGVSYQTVSRVLNEHPSIRETTKQRVLDVITEIGYRPNQAARALVTSRSRNPAGGDRGCRGNPARVPRLVQLPG